MEPTDIFVINKDKVIPEDNFRHRTIYTMIHKQEDYDEKGFPTLINKAEESLDSPDAYAYKYRGESQEKFYVKVNDYGMFIDPMNVAHTKNIDKVRDSLQIWRWRSISRNAFNEYINYLKTQNHTHYTQSMRES